MARLATFATGLVRLPTRSVRRAFRRRGQPALRLVTRAAARAERWAYERARGAATTPVVRERERAPDVVAREVEDVPTELVVAEASAPIAVRVRLAPPSPDEVDRARRALYGSPSSVDRALVNVHGFSSLPDALVAPLEQVVHSARDKQTRARAAILLSRTDSDDARRAVARLRAHVARRDEFLGRRSELHELLASNDLASNDATELA